MLNVFVLKNQAAVNPVVPTHKNCGFPLDEKQADKFQKELVKSWGFEQEDN